MHPSILNTDVRARLGECHRAVALHRFAGVAIVAALLALAGCGARGGGEPASAQATAHTDAHRQADEHGHADDGDHDFAALPPARAADHGVKIATAAGGEIAETVTLTGRLVIDPRRIAAVRARFGGPVVRVYKEVGDAVKQGEPLADVESNESLTVYTVRAPLAGVVLERHTNVGDVAGTDALFRVGDVAVLQAELKAFPSQRALLRTGAAALVQLGDAEARGRVVAIAPQVEGHTQAIDVRVALEPVEGVALVPGQFVTGRVERGRGNAAVVVPFEAVQRLEGREVVFVPEQQGFRARAVKVGRRSAAAIEIVDGLAPGAAYVAGGAFVLKAEIGKNEAGHEH